MIGEVHVAPDRMDEFKTYLREILPDSRAYDGFERIDDDLLQWFRDQVNEAGGGNYQTLINAALREYVEGKEENLKSTLRSVVREEFARYGKKESK